MIEQYQEKYKSECLTAFKSNVPDFFATGEIGQFENWLELVVDERNSNRYYYNVFVIQGQVIGCGGFLFEESKNEVFLTWGLIHRDYQRKGYGVQLLYYRLKQITQLYPIASILIDTTQYSYPFFEKYGFKVTTIINDYYSKGLHRYDMMLEHD